MSTVVQSTFEKAVIAVMLHLFELPKDVRGFNLKKSLFDDLKINSSNWDKIRNSTRGIPPDYHKHIRTTLVNKYDVNPHFLDTGKGSMFLTGKFDVNERTVPYGKMPSELERLRVENHQLKELVETQKKLILQLEAQLKK